MNDCQLAVESALKLIGQEKLADAEQVLEQALSELGDHPELHEQLVRIELLSQRELQAVSRLAKCVDTPSFAKSGQALCDHFFLRAKLASKLGVVHDAQGEAATSQLAKLGFDTPTSGIGIGITACLIVKNEEKFIRNCLESIQPIVDEIVVVDTGSTDRTVEIAKEFGAVIGEFEWINDFAAARNKSLEMASQSWLLWIDADEVLDAAGHHMIREAVIRPQFGGYQIQIVNYLADTGAKELFVHMPVRLFRNLPEIRFEGKIHEQIASKFPELGLSSAHLPGVLLHHHGYRPELMKERDKINRTMNMILAELEQNPDDVFQLFNLAMTYSVALESQKCVDVCAKAAGLLEPGCSIGYNVYQLWMSHLSRLGRFTEVQSILKKCVDQGFDCILARYESAYAAVNAGDLELAKEQIEIALDQDWPPRLAGDYGVHSYKKHLLHSRIMLQLGEPEVALNSAENALKNDANLDEALGIKAAALGKLGRSNESLEILEVLIEKPAQKADALLAACTVSREAGQLDRSLQYAKARWDSGICDEAGFLQWVTTAEALCNSNEIVEAYQAYSSKFEANSAQMVNWGRAFAETNQPDQAIVCFTEAFKLDPTNANALFNTGDIQYQSGHFLDAAHCYEQALRVEPLNAQGWFVLGNSLFQVGAVDGAKTAYQQCLQIDPNHAQAAHNLALLDEVQRSA